MLPTAIVPSFPRVIEEEEPLVAIGASAAANVGGEVVAGSAEAAVDG